MKTFFALLLATLSLGSARADLSVASLSTITTDLAKNIGGTHVQIAGIIKAGIDPHEF